jgi:hypothetical protein
MLRPPTPDGRGASDFHDFDDAEIPAKRGQIDDGPPDSRPSDVPSGDRETPDERPTPGEQPAEGRPDMGFPGADQEDDLPQKLGERIENGSSSSMAIGEPDVLPDVEVPDTTM